MTSQHVSDIDVIITPIWSLSPKSEVISPHPLVQVIKGHYCIAREVGKDGDFVEPLLSATCLDEQAGAYIRACRDVAPGLVTRRKIALAAAAALAAKGDSSLNSTNTSKASSEPPTQSPTSKMWEMFTANQKCSDEFPEFAKLAEIVLVMVGGSVENERTFSSLAFIKSEQRNRLQIDNLNICLRLYSAKKMYTLNTFPYERAFEAWDGEVQRRGGSLAV